MRATVEDAMKLVYEANTDKIDVDAMKLVYIRANTDEIDVDAVKLVYKAITVSVDAAKLV